MPLPSAVAQAGGAILLSLNSAFGSSFLYRHFHIAMICFAGNCALCHSVVKIQEISCQPALLTKPCYHLLSAMQNNVAPELWGSSQAATANSMLHSCAL